MVGHDPRVDHRHYDVVVPLRDVPGALQFDLGVMPLVAIVRVVWHCHGPIQVVRRHVLERPARQQPLAQQQRPCALAQLLGGVAECRLGWRIRRPDRRERSVRPCHQRARRRPGPGHQACCLRGQHPLRLTGATDPRLHDQLTRYEAAIHRRRAVPACRRLVGGVHDGQHQRVVAGARVRAHLDQMRPRARRLDGLQRSDAKGLFENRALGVCQVQVEVRCIRVRDREIHSRRGGEGHSVDVPLVAGRISVARNRDRHGHTLGAPVSVVGEDRIPRVVGVAVEHLALRHGQGAGNRPRGNARNDRQRQIRVQGCLGRDVAVPVQGIVPPHSRLRMAQQHVAAAVPVEIARTPESVVPIPRQVDAPRCPATPFQRVNRPRTRAVVAQQHLGAAVAVEIRHGVEAPVAIVRQAGTPQRRARSAHLVVDPRAGLGVTQQDIVTAVSVEVARARKAVVRIACHANATQRGPGTVHRIVDPRAGPAVPQQHVVPAVPVEVADPPKAVVRVPRDADPP